MRALRCALAGMICFGWIATGQAAEWQFAVDTGVKKIGKAFLWIPPDCEYVRGLIVGQQVILEKVALQDPRVRAAAARGGLAILFIVPGAIAYDDFGPDGKGEAAYTDIVSRLAEASGYAELALAPFLTIGHSGGAIPAWRMGYWKPERCFGVIGLHAAPIGPPKHDQKAQLKGVPVLVITGQYETWNPKQSAEHHWRWCRGDILAMRARWDRALMSVLVQPGAGHFNWDDELARYVSMFIETAAERRIPKAATLAGEYPKLKDIPLDSGWLTDNTLITPARYPVAAYKDYTGDPTMAFWHLDEELAKANEAYGTSHHGKELQLVTFLDNGKPMNPAWMQSQKLTPIEDGMTARVKADFVRDAPPQFRHPQQLGHAEGPIQFRLFGGWSGGGEQLGPDTFRIRFDRFGFARRRPGSLMVMAFHPGDTKFAYTEQPCSIDFPERNGKGKPQQISFAPIPNQKVGTAEVKLNATSDSGLPVEFCVIAGPAELKGNTLSLTRIPPRTKCPVKVSLIAYQWGRSIEPLVQSAEPIERSFLIAE